MSGFNLKRSLKLPLMAAMLAFTAAAPVAVHAWTAPTRTLPAHINRIFIREFKNNSRLWGAQADLTLKVTDEFIADGRLDVVQNERSDLRLEGKIKSYRVNNTGSGGDQFPLITILDLDCVIELWDPYDPDRIAPLYRFNVPTRIQYISDPRRAIAEMDTEARDRLYTQAAKNIVATVISGTPEPLRPLEAKAVKKFEERRGKQQFDPVITEPRFPKVTPAPRRNKTFHDDFAN